MSADDATVIIHTGQWLVKSQPPAAGDPEPTSAGTLVRQLWALLVIGFLCQLPPLASNLFVAVQAADLQTTAALIGGLRGLGGLAALAVGVLVAPLIDRLPRAYSVAAGLLVTAVATGLVAAGQLFELALFFVLVGAAGAVLLPSIQSAGMDYRPGPDGVRAATLLTGIPSLAAVAAGPLLALPAEWWGWRADYAGLAALSVILAGLAIDHLSHARPPGVSQAGYLDQFRQVAAAPGAAALLIGSTFRSVLFVAGLTFLAPFFSDQFGLSITLVGLLFMLGGVCFFVANVTAGRLMARKAVPAERLVLASLLLAGLTAPVQYLAPSVPLAVAMLCAQTAGQGAFLASLVAMLVERWPEQRGALLGLNVAGLNLGTFAGAAIGGLALGLRGYVGLAGLLVLLAVLALGTLLRAVWTGPSPGRTLGRGRA